MSNNNDSQASLHALQIASSSVLPMVLKAAVELGVLDIIHTAGPTAMVSSSQVASELESTNPNAVYLLDQMLCLLATHSVLTCSGSNPHRLYGLTPVSKYFLRNCNPDGGSLTPMLDLLNDTLTLDVWSHWKEAILDGGSPFERAHGKSAMDYIAENQSFSSLFMTAYKDWNKLFVVEMLETYKGFEGLTCLVDVGGGNGSILNAIISKYPSIKGINFDLPSKIQKAPSYPGIEHVAGDMTQSIPKGDAIFIKWVLHSWKDEDIVKTFKNCHAALPSNGKVMVVDFVVPEVPEANVALQKTVFQLNMFFLSLNPRRKERTEKEFDSLAKAAGFSGVRVFPCAYSFSLVEIYKN